MCSTISPNSSGPSYSLPRGIDGERFVLGKTAPPRADFVMTTSTEALHTYGALLEEAKRTNVDVGELGSTLATSRARAREDAMRGRDEEDPGVRSKREELEEMVYIEEALENEEKTPIARARECAR